MAKEITKNAPNDSFLGENGDFQANSPQNTGFSDTPSAKPVISEVEKPQSSSLKDEKDENPLYYKEAPKIEENQGFFNELTSFLTNFLEKQGFSKQDGQNPSNLAENNPQSVDFDQKIEVINEIKDKSLKPSDFADYEDFLAKYPNISLQSLEKDQSFLLFLEGRDKTASIENIYKNYDALKQFIEKEAINAYIIKQAQEKSSVGALSSPNAGDAGFFTRDQVLRMSKDQISRNYDKIRKSQQSW